MTRQSYDPSSAIFDGGADTILGRVARELVRRYGQIPDELPYGDGPKIDRALGVPRFTSNNVAHRLRRGWRPRGKAIALQPAGLSYQLLMLELASPGMSRRAQAELLDTSVGMVRDTIYRLRRDGHLAYGEGRRARRRS